MNDTAIKAGDAEIWRPSAALNPQRLEYLWALTDRIAWSTSVPDSLRGERKGTGQNSTLELFDDRTILANVFAVVEQADRWDISPFALLGSAAIVRGKLAFEGKVIAAVLESKFKVKLHHYFRGEPRTDGYHVYICDEPLPEEVLSELKPGYRHDRYKILDGSVSAWKTSGNGSPWRPDTYADMLIYRGDRQWARVYKSSAILGVLAEDEAMQSFLEAGAQAAIPLVQRFAATGQGFSPDNITTALEHKQAVAMDIVDQTTGEVVSEATGAQHGGDALKTTAEPKADKAKASARPAEQSAGNQRDGQTDNGGRPTETQPSSATATEVTAGRAGDASNASTSRVSADTFREYHEALGRMGNKEGVDKAHRHFWSGKGIKLDHQDDMKLARDIYDNHTLRAEGKVEAGYLAKEIANWISEVTGGQL